MATQQVTEPLILDETGLRIEQRLAEIKNALQPTNACIDIDISLPATGWTGNGPYTYTYNNAHITTGCKVKVNFLETESASGGILYLEYEKVVGGVQFTAKSVPTTPIPVRIHILNADAESIMATTADEVSTNAVTGASNVEQALGIVSDNIAEVNDKVGNVPEGETVEGQITSLNSKIATVQIVDMTSEFGAVSGTIKLIRWGKIRILAFDSAKAPSIGYFPFSSFSAGDCPSYYAHGLLDREDNHTSWGIWVRPAGTIGQSNYSASTTASGSVIWVVP